MRDREGSNPGSIQHATCPGNRAKRLTLGLLAVLLAAHPGEAARAGGVQVGPAPPDLGRATVPEEPDWDRASLLQEVREEERRAALVAVEQARRAARAEAQETISGLETELERARADEAALRTRLAGAKNESNDLNAAVEKGRSEAESLRRALESARGENDSLRSSVASLQRERDAVAQHAAALQTEVEKTNSLEGDLAQLRAERDEAVRRARTAEAGREEALAEVQRAKEEAGRAGAAEVGEAKRRLGEAQALLDRRDEEVEDLQGTIQELQRAGAVDCTGPVSEAYARGLNEARNGDGEEGEAAALRGDLERARSDIDTARKRITEQDEQIASLGEDLRALRAKQASATAPELVPASAAGEGGGRRAAMMEAYFREVQAAMETTLAKRVGEERERAERAFRQVLRVISSGEERRQAREVWEKSR